MRVRASPCGRQIRTIAMVKKTSTKVACGKKVTPKA
jgi:hypothetical protein